MDEPTTSLNRPIWPASFVALAAVLLVPLVIDLRGKDVFRQPKEIALRCAALIIVAVFGMALALGWRPLGVWRDRAVLLALAVLGWTGIVSLTSTNRFLSAMSAITVTASVVIVFASRAAADRHEVLALDIAFIPAVINGVLVSLQEFNIWQPFRTAETGTHLGSSALIGNPNDVGTYLLAPAVAALVATFAWRTRRRYAYAAVACITVLGLFACATRTAIIAYVLAAIVFTARRSVRSLLAITVFVAFTGAIAFTGSRTLGRALQNWRTAVVERRYDLLFSERLPPFLAAIDMVRDHPLTGAGPGTFKWLYMPYRVELAKKYPVELTRGWPMNFGETHSDHLQIAAETGLPGYLLFLLIIGMTGCWALRGQQAEPQGPWQLFIRNFAPPFAVAVLVVALAQFPLQIAGPRMALLFFAGLCISGKRS